MKHEHTRPGTSVPISLDDHRGIGAAIDAYLAARRPEDPRTLRVVLSRALFGVTGAEALARGDWVLHAPLRVQDFSEVRGYGSARVFGALSRFADWLKAQGALDGAARDRLEAAIVNARRCHIRG